MANEIYKLKVLGTEYLIKDSAARASLASLISSLGTAAYKDVKSTLESMAAGDIIDGPTMKDYVDAQVGAIHKFDVVVADTLPTASADTMYKLYLVPKGSGATGNAKVEWITIRSGEEGSYTYAWEQIGDTEVDLTDYVKKSTKVAGISLGSDIAVASLQSALELKSMAYVDSATGSTSLQTIDSITMKEMTVAGDAAVTYATASASLTKADYTPAGSITGSAISGGSIEVTLKDAAAATEASLTTTTFTPAGTVAAVEGGSFSALKTAAFTEDTTGTQIEGTVSAPSINLTSTESTFVTGLTGGSVASFTEGAFTAASIGEGFFSAGSLASKAADTFTAGSLTKGNAIAAATEGVVASIDSQDAECLVFTAAATDNVLDYDCTYTAPSFTEGAFTQGSLPSIDVTKFSGGSKAADTFVANVLQGADTGKINNISAAALANAPVFTGSKYKVATTADTALKTVAFTATNSAAIVNKVEYVKQAIDSAAFTGTAATLGFSGTKVENALVSAVSYDKAASTAAFSVKVTPETDTLTKTAKTVEITVAP